LSDRVVIVHLARRDRLAESRRQLTKLLIIAALTENGLQIGQIDVGKVTKDEILEAADIARHGSPHVPKLLINVQQLAGFEHYVPAWSRLSIEAGVLEVIAKLEKGDIVVGLPSELEKRCVLANSTLEKEFRKLKKRPSG
jgi:hypothetical protein